METIEEHVYNYPTKHPEGFTQDEMNALLKEYPGVNMKRFNGALHGITCMVIDNEIITYHCDIVSALRCGIENRGLTWWEWD